METTALGEKDALAQNGWRSMEGRGPWPQWPLANRFVGNDTFRQKCYANLRLSHLFISFAIETERQGPHNWRERSLQPRILIPYEFGSQAESNGVPKKDRKGEESAQMSSNHPGRC